MTTFFNSNYRHGGKNLTVSSVKTSVAELMSLLVSGDRCDAKNPTCQQWTRPHDFGRSFAVLCRLLFLSLTLTVASTMTFAGEAGQDQDRDHASDPTGTWLIRDGDGFYILMVFHEGGTLTGDFQGEAAFVPGGQPPFDIIVTPQSGVWRKTGPKTFAVTFVALEYQVNPPNGSIFQIDKSQLTGVLINSGNEMRLTALTTVFNPDGTQKGNSFPDTANGVRIPLEILPNTSHSLPIPVMPPL